MALNESENTMQSTMKNNQESINVLLEITKIEYEKEYQRIAAIENKASISLPIIGGYFFALSQEGNLSSFVKVRFSTVADFMLSFFIENSYCLSLFSVLIAIVLVAFILKPGHYSAIIPRCFNNNTYLQNNPSEISLKVIDQYVKSIEQNRKINRQRAHLYLYGWLFAVFSLIMFVIYTFV